MSGAKKECRCPLTVHRHGTLACYRRLLDRHPVPLGALTGHDLMCWCPLVDSEGKRVPCHADVLLELANGGVV